MRFAMTGHCLITGGAGAMGAAVAKSAAQRGHAVSLLSLASEQNVAAALVHDIRSGGGQAEFIAADVSKEEDILRAYAQAASSFGAPTGVFHAAGVFVGNMVRDLDFAAITKLIAVNVTGLMICCREAARLMSTETGGQGGSIVNVSSMAATIGGRPGHSVYAASKGAVDIFTKGFAKEVAREGIRVNSVRPGAVSSPMTAALDADPALKKSVEESIPMGRIGDPQEIADIALWLMSPASSLVTGAHIDAGGGGFNVAGSV
ncbi:MAG: SDR family oxidoreductase [Litoreibacter sp.]|nr:SDR family oxidoreductase [Litoreibacter sp.]MCY4333715.1 SDR family oxidoreductase [Litoreibacter sp.]